MAGNLYDLNRYLNQALRAVNSAIVAASKVGLESVKDDTRALVEIMEALSNVQRRIYEIEPELEYHYDASRPDTQYMRQHRQHLTKASEHEAQGDIAGALDQLRLALDMEPPPIAYEVVLREKGRLEKLRASGSPSAAVDNAKPVADDS